jgi:hypothetical protein
MLTEPEEKYPPSYHIVATLNGILDDDLDMYEPYITPLHVDITEHSWDEVKQEDRDQKIGTLEGYIFHVGLATNEGMDITEAADSVSSGALEYCDAVIQPGKNAWRKSIERQFDYQLFDTDVLALTTMKINPECRGKKIGLLAIVRTMQLFGAGCGLTLIKPWPLQYTPKEFEQIAKEGKTEQGWTDQKRKEDFEKLRMYWGSLGFERLGKTHFYGFPGCRPIPALCAVAAGTSKGPPQSKQSKRAKIG